MGLFIVQVLVVWKNILVILRYDRKTAGQVKPSKIRPHEYTSPSLFNEIYYKSLTLSQIKVESGIWTQGSPSTLKVITPTRKSNGDSSHGSGFLVEQESLMESYRMEPLVWSQSPL